MLTDEAILVYVFNYLPSRRIRVDSFETKFSLDDKTLRLVDRHVYWACLHQHVSFRKNSFLGDGLPNVL